MKLIDQVISLDQAKLLKSLGVKQESHFYHHPNFETPAPGHTSVKKYGTQYKVTQVKNDAAVTLSAFTVAELGVMLPTGYDTMRVTGKTPDNSAWQGYDMAGRDFTKEPYSTEAECRAAMLIHLLENKLITVEEVNARLCENQ